MDSYTVISALVILLVVYCLLWLPYTPTRMPPGPKTLPLIGNIYQLYGRDVMKVFSDWHKTYGPIITVKVGPFAIHSLGSYEVTNELLDRRGGIYSSRPDFSTAIRRWTEGSQFSSLLPYNDTWKAQHKMQMFLLNSQVCQSYYPILDLQSKQLLHDMLSTDQFVEEFHRFVDDSMYSLVYGNRAQGIGRVELNKLFQEIMPSAQLANLLEDIIPILRIFPKCLAKWRQDADRLKHLTMQMSRKCADSALNQGSWNLSKELMSKYGESPSREHIHDVSLELYVAGRLTMSISLEIVVMAIILHPDAARKARTELDIVVGSDRLPSPDDVPKLPFLDAFLREVFRWRPILHLNAPHSLTQSDVYRGYQFSTNTMIIANTRELNMDTDIFESPEEFKPERWVEDPRLPQATFGFGRRICPGRLLAWNSIALVASRLLWAYNFGHAYREGRRIEIDPLSSHKHDLLWGPAPFEASCKLRSQGHRAVIEKEWAAAEKDEDVLLEQVQQKFHSIPNIKARTDAEISIEQHIPPSSLT